MKPRGAFLFYFGFTIARIAPLVMLVWMSARSRLYGSDARFAFGESALAIPFQLDDNRIYLRVGINGSRPLSFMLDSGASKTVLSVRNARSFGMEMQPLEKVGTGIGAELPDVYLIKDAVSFNLPGFVFSDDGIVAIPLDRTQECLDAAAAAGGGRSRTAPTQTSKDQASRVVDGILGQDFLSAVVIEIDYAARLINLYAPANYEYTGPGEKLSLETESQFIFVRALLRARNHPPAIARLVVDTGAGTALSLTRQFAETHQLLLPANKLRPATECGIAGSARETTLVGKLDVLQLGGLKVSNPVTVFYQRTAQRWYDGLLGTQALRNFKVIFDCTRGRMILERSHLVHNAR